MAPASIQQLVVYLVAENQELKSRLSRIEEQLAQNSQNSSQPPSQDGFRKPAVAVKAKSQKQRGGRPGHPGHQPKFYELSGLDVVIPHVPLVWPICGVGLTGTDPEPYRHQILELPVLRPQITEHERHQLTCAHCGGATMCTTARYGRHVALW